MSLIEFDRLILFTLFASLLTTGHICLNISEQVQSMLSSKSTEMDNQQLQSLIEGNKRWLETRRKDPGMYPFKPLKICLALFSVHNL